MVARLRTALVAVVIAVALLAACSDDDSTDDYVTRVSRICTEVEHELSGLESTRAESRRERAALIDDVIATSREAVRRLKAIEPPDGDDGETAERFVSTLEREIDNDAVPALEDLRDAVISGDPRAADDAGARLRRLERSKSDRYAHELGANACAA
jgi:outer membrane murein-binding lipoprotein Lpp